MFGSSAIMPLISGGGTPPPTIVDMTMSGAFYDLGSPIFSPASLETGSGTATVTLPPSNAATIEGYFRIPSTATTQYQMLKLSDSAGWFSALGINSNSLYIQSNSPLNGSFISSPVAISAGVHHIAQVWYYDGTYYNFLFVDGVLTISYNQGNSPQAGSMTVNINLPSSNYIDVNSLRVSSNRRYISNFTAPSSLLTRDANTLGLWQFLGNGTGT